MSVNSKKRSSALAVARRVKRADGGEVSYDPMTGMRIGADTERTEPEAAPNRYARATIQSIANMPKAMLWDAPRELGEAVERMPMPGAERTPENEAAMQEAAGQSFMAAVGTAGGTMPFAQRGAAGIFGGKLAQTADHAALARAEQMHAQGVAPEQIHADTGWFLGPDDKWRFEIGDQNSRFAQSRRNPQSVWPIDWPHTTEVGTAFEHPDLYRAYPGLKDAELGVENLGERERGYYRRPVEVSPGDLIEPPGEKIGLAVKERRYGQDLEDARSTMLHEMQHAVQAREGFVPGSSPDAMQQVVTAGNDARLWKGMIEAGHTPEEIRAAFPKVIGRDVHPAAAMLAERMTPEQLAKIETDPYEAYRRIYGEVEARNVQARRDMSAEERARSFPGSTEDIPREKQLIGAPHDPAAPTLPAADAVPGAAAGAGDVGSGGGGPLGAGSLPEAQAAAARWAGERKPLEGLPGALKIGDEHFVPGPIGKVHDVAEAYMREHHPDRPYTPPTKYHKIDPEHSQAIAQAYEDMAHTPNDPATKASYAALIDETAKQYQAIKKTGLKIEPIPAGAEDPYAANPRLAAKDVAENNHLWFFPTEHGFGTVNKISDSPMLRNTGEKIGDHPLLANDMFRIVHDYFGHLKEGHGFRAAGEDNAWRTHSAMYSDIARPAMTTETRGQNAWLNYGPHGEKNRTAKAADTIYADQKVGLMPEWTMRDRGSDAPLVAYHAGPHSFGRFDYSKIGTGEGNQAYGQGLYLAGHEPVSEWYRHQLSTRHDPLLKQYGIQDVGHVIGSHLADVGGDAAQLAAKYAGERDKLIQGGDTSKATRNMIDEYARRIDYLNNPQRATGHMYQVGMDVNPEHLLDYDNSFANQSQHVQGRTGPMLEQSIAEQKAAIERLLDKGGTGTPGSRMFRPFTSFKKQDLEGKLLMLQQAGPAPFKGSDIYQRAGMPAGNPNEGAVKASQRLRGMDIPGMRYKDAGSRAPGQQGSHNYVMFGDDMLKILRKYGVVGIPAAGVLAADGEERRAMGGKVNSAMQIARRVKRAGGGGAFGVLSPAEQAEVDDVAPMAIGRSPDDSPVLFKTADPRFGITQQDFDRGLAVGMNAATVGGKGVGPARRIADDTGAALTKRVNLPVRRSNFVDPDTGLAIPGPAYTKEAQAINRDIAQSPKGEGPLDLSLQGQVPNVEQRPLPRYEPPRGISARMRDAMESQTVREGLEGSMRQGAGVRDWYHTEPVRQAFINDLGKERGDAAFKNYMDLVAATSPRSDVPTNIRNASYYYGGADPAKTNPYPFGHIAQKLHKQNVGTVASDGGWDVMRNPKPASFAENLRGNLEPVTVDTHAFRNIGMRTGDPRFLETSLSNVYRQGHSGAEDTLAGRYGELRDSPKGTMVTFRPQQLAKEGRLSMEEAKGIPAFWAAKPTDSEYAAAEQMFREAGERVGMRPADAQAAAWAGGGDMTGLGTVGTHTFPELMNERITFTAKMRGESPQKVLSDFVNKRKPLLSIAGTAAAVPAVGAAMDDGRAAGGKVSSALALARDIKRAAGGAVHTGAIMGNTDGRADEVPMEVPDGAYVLTADHVSSMGEGNTLSGFKKLDQMFPASARKHSQPRAAVKRAAGGAVPIYAADGEYVICPEDITDRWGDLEAGHRYLDAWQTASRKEHVNTLRNLAPPAQD